jgi:archaemetzincin
MRELFKLWIPLLFLFSCDDHRARRSTALEQNIIISLQPFDDVPSGHIKYIESSLSKLYGSIEIKDPIPLPASAYYPKRHRYRADSLIIILKNITPPDHVTIGLTTKDISHTKGNIEDTGLMGLGFQPGSSCIVSTFRLSKKNVLEQYFKLAIHELGHTQGLAHCPQTTCYMRDCKGKNHWDEENGFCDHCRSALQAKGWSFPGQARGLE